MHETYYVFLNICYQPFSSNKYNLNLNSEYLLIHACIMYRANWRIDMVDYIYISCLHECILQFIRYIYSHGIVRTFTIVYSPYIGRPFACRPNHIYKIYKAQAGGDNSNFKDRS